MLAETATTFFLRGDPATVSFEESSAGVVDRMVIVERDWQLTAGRNDPNAIPEPQAISSPRIVPVAEANLSASRPMRWSIETKRLGSG